MLSGPARSTVAWRVTSSTSGDDNGAGMGAGMSVGSSTDTGARMGGVWAWLGADIATKASQHAGVPNRPAHCRFRK